MLVITPSSSSSFQALDSEREVAGIREAHRGLAGYEYWHIHIHSESREKRHVIIYENSITHIHET